MVEWFVPLAVGTVCIVGAWLLMIPGRMMAPYAIVALILTGVSGLMNGSVGPPIQRGVNRLNDAAGDLVSKYTGVAVTLIASMIIAGCTILWVVRKQFDMRTYGFAGLCPIAVTFIPGAIGGLLVGLFGIIPMVVTAAVKAGFGVG